MPLIAGFGMLIHTKSRSTDLFNKYGVTDYLGKCFEPLHTQGRQWLMAEIDEFIDIRKKNEI